MAEPQRLPVQAVRQQLPRLSNYLSKTDYDRLEALLPLFTPAEASQADLAACLAQVATGRSTQEQLADFRALRGRLRQAARLPEALKVDIQGTTRATNAVKAAVGVKVVGAVDVDGDVGVVVGCDVVH